MVGSIQLLTISMINFHDLFIYTLYWAIFAGIHSITASLMFKSFVGISDQNYRIWYNIISVVTLGILFILVPPITPSFIAIFSEYTIFHVASIIFLVLGSTIFIWGLTTWDLSGFIGLSEESDELNVDGAYRFSRHPVYTGAIFIFLSPLFIELSTTTLSWFIGIAGYFALGSRIEENKLRQYFADEYHQYMENTGWLFPVTFTQWKGLLGTNEVSQ